MRGIQAFLIATIVLPLDAAAQSLTKQQSNAANHIAQVIAIEIECPEYEANQGMIAVLAMGHNLQLGTEPLNSRLIKLVGEHRTGLRAAGNKVGCLVSWGLYGPGGENVPDLIRKK